MVKESEHTGEQLIYPPESTERLETAQQAYLQAHDAVEGKEYACLVYTETNTKKQEWKLKVELKGVRTTVINPDSSSLRRNLSKAASAGEEYYVMGYHITPTEEDPRLLENRIYFDELANPLYLEVHLITRNADGSPGERQVAQVPWPDTPEEEGRRAVHSPRATFSHDVEELAYVESYDVLANHTYAYLAYKKTHKKSGKWELRIAGNGTSGASLEPESARLHKRIKDAADEGREYIVFGSPLATKNDARMAENRLYFGADGQPTHAEIHLVTRTADGSAQQAQVARFDWPG